MTTPIEKKKILVIGSGGREHALCWRLAQDGHWVMCAPGNPGIATVAVCVDVKLNDFDAILALADHHNVDVVLVGPEAPLVAGLADQLRAAGITTFGPGADGARLEGSKVFSKQFFAKHGIRSAQFAIANSVLDADNAISSLGGALVVKADGLAAGKGVAVCKTTEQACTAAREMLADRKFGDAGAHIVIERRIVGREVSLLAITDGIGGLEILASAEDHKTIFDNDEGPNTGGMGTVSPAWISAHVQERIVDEILRPTLAGLRAENIDYRGVLYAGVMVEPNGTPWLLEYNCRFGDPETQSILVRLQGDFASVLIGAARGALPTHKLTWRDDCAVCVIIAAPGYPDAPILGGVLSGADVIVKDVQVFHAGTNIMNGQLVSTGGRVVGVTSVALNVDSARRLAYQVADGIALDGKQFRRDIGLRKSPD
jgi:phosphoribosylamine---glycine ligase